MDRQTWPPITPEEDERMLRDQEREREYWRRKAERDRFELPTLSDPNAGKAIIWERARLVIEHPDPEDPMTTEQAEQVLIDYAPELWNGRPREATPDPDLAAALQIDRSMGHGRVPCPAHGDHRSKTLSFKFDGERLLIHCFAGCTFDEIRKAAL